MYIAEEYENQVAASVLTIVETALLSACKLWIIVFPDPVSNVHSGTTANTTQQNTNHDASHSITTFLITFLPGLLTIVRTVTFEYHQFLFINDSFQIFISELRNNFENVLLLQRGLNT